MLFLALFKWERPNQHTDEKENLGKEWPDHVVTLEGKNFYVFIEKYPLSIVEFWAPWCAPCKAMTPRLRRLSKIYKGKVAFGRLNTQANQDIAKQYKIMGIPHLIFFRYGKKVSSVTGVKSVGYIKGSIESLLEKGDK